MSTGLARGEATTPAGAAVLSLLVDEWAPMPEMVVRNIGVGAGQHDHSDVANVLRLVVGDLVAETASGKALQIDANVDDLDPRVWPAAIQAVLDSGAHDAWITPITMKKGRPAFVFSVLCDPTEAAQVRASIFEQTSTIGLRESLVAKHSLDRSFSAVEVDGQKLSVKLAWQDGRVINRSVEWEDVVVASRILGLPTKQVLLTATERAAELPGL